MTKGRIAIIACMIVGLLGGYSYAANIALGKGYVKSRTPNESFPDTGDTESTDGVLSYLKADSYAFQLLYPTPLTISITIDLEAVCGIEKVKYHKNECADLNGDPSYYDPDTVTVYASEDGDNFVELGQATAPDGIWYSVAFPRVMARYVRVTLYKVPVYLRPNYLFVDEIQVLEFAQDIEVTPTSLDVRLAYGASVTEGITIRNNGDEILEYMISPEAPDDAESIKEVGLSGNGAADTGACDVPAGWADRIDLSQPHREDELLVKFKSGTETLSRRSAVAALGGEVEREYGLVPGLCLVKLDEAGDLKTAVGKFAALGDVEYAEPNYAVHALEGDVLPGDASFGEQWGMYNTGQNGGGAR